MPRLLTGRWSWWKVAALVVSSFLLWCFTAYPRGALRAHLDGMRGHDEVRPFGDPLRELQLYAGLLKDRYGVRVNMAAGWEVTDELVRHSHGYNDVAIPRVLRKHGRDIFEECWVEAKARWEAEHPD